MSPEEQTTNDLVRENIRLTRENNKLVKKLWRAEVLGFWSRILFFVVVIGVPIFLYKYYIAEYLGDIQGAYEQLLDKVNILGEVPGGEMLGKAIDGIQGHIGNN